MTMISTPLKPYKISIFSITTRLHSSKPTTILSQNRVQKLISSQSDPLLAKEIFDLASIQPNFHPSYSTFHSLILKLAHSHHFSHINSLLTQLKSRNYPISPSLFSRLIRVYGETNHPEKALKLFYTILEFNTKPLPKHLNAILRVLVARRRFLRSALDLFRSAHRYGVLANVESYNILMSAFCLNGDLSIAYRLFNEMFKRDLVPDIESYRILMQGLCRRSQVSKAVDLLEDMLNKGFVPDALSYTTLLNSLCRKTKLKEAYKLLCRMKVKGCNPDIVHYNTVIFGFCREKRAVDAVKVLGDMSRNGCLPNLVSYRTLVGGLCNQGLYDEASKYTREMICKGFSPHFSVFHVLIKGLCNVGKTEEACELLVEMLRFGEAPHVDTWVEIVTRMCISEDEVLRVEDMLKGILKVEIKPHTKIVEAGAALEEYININIQTRRKKF